MNRQTPRWIPVVVTAVYAAIALAGMMHHEPWRDELQAWMVVTDADSYADVYRNMRYEGNPMLWQSLLFPLTRVGHDPRLMQALHLAIALGFIWVFNRFAPLPMAARVLFSFGYFTLFEYGLISRGYGLGLLLSLIACALLRGARPRPVALGVVLFLLANTSMYGMVIAGGLAGVAILEHLSMRAGAGTTRRAAPVLGLGIAAAGVLISAVQIWPEPDNTFFVSWPQGLFDGPRFLLVASKVAAAHFPVPGPGAHWWNTNLFLGDGGVLTALLPAAVLLTGATVLLRRPVILLFYLAMNGVLLFLFYLTLLVHARYYGHFFVLLLLALWLAAEGADRPWGPAWLRRAAAAGGGLERPFLALVLAANLAGGAVAWARDRAQPFTTSGHAAAFIRESPYADLPVVATRDYQVSPLAALLDRPLFYPERMSRGSFLTWDRMRRDLVGGAEVAAAVRHVLPEGGGRCLLVLSFPAADDPGGAAPADLLGGDLRIRLLAGFSPGVVADERFLVYSVEQILGIAQLAPVADADPDRARDAVLEGSRGSTGRGTGRRSLPRG